MFCINCFHSKTRVVNSRAKSKHPAVWRRRSCPECSYVFSTYERPSLTESHPVLDSQGSSSPFNLGHLIVSIAESFQHNKKAAYSDSLWLAQTIEQSLAVERRQISTADIAATTHQVLKRYDELAAIQYAAKHQLIVSTRRRPGRPPITY